MELELARTYLSGGTNGSLCLEGKKICATIELPWINNEPRRSCIPEGRYRLVTRYSPKFKKHLLLKGVPGRSLILLHPANNAAKELKGCIAPVSFITGPGSGNASRPALKKLLALVLKNEGPAFLTIRSDAEAAMDGNNIIHQKI